MNLWIEEKLPLILLKEYELNSHTKGYHTDMMKFLKARLEPENEFDKFAVAVKKCDVVVGHLSKGKTDQFAKTISFFLRWSKKHSCKVEVTGKRGTLALGIKTPYTLWTLYLLEMQNSLTS